MATLEALSCGIPVIGSAFAIPEELRHYEFTEVAENMPASELLEYITILVEKFRAKKKEIHERIKTDFGRKQYEDKIFKIIASKNERKRNIVIVSLFGTGNAGGVERVCYYLSEILKEKYDVKVLERTRISFWKLNALIQPLFMSVRLIFHKNKIIFSNSWTSFLYPVDFSIHHGTTKGYTGRIAGSKTIGSEAISFMEKLSCKTAKNILAVSKNAADELVSLYGADKSKITVINNFVDDTIFFPVFPNQ
jgi:glycosyltransferase involved in cell wall biosynthesis